ncbi:MAG: hypothetical protein LZ169_02470 [Thaumarchaeota archaeon]|jgi:HEPN domain-containing protein|nr:hypothetical protein [Candidatus Wolframiiraptor allenii]
MVCLRLVGVEYSKVHDVGDILKARFTRFPSWFREEIERLQRSLGISRRSASKMYGVEVIGEAPEESLQQG